MLNIVALMGRLVYDPELKTTRSGTNVCSFRIAVDRSFARQGEERKADFIDVTAWRQTAEFVSKYFQKGSMIAIEGSLQTRQYQDKNGNNRTATEVLASQVSFCGGKTAEKPSVRDFDQQTENHHVREANTAHSAPQKPQSVPEYSQGSADDFSVIDDSEDLPF
ncbi:MAG: single-stranded DNA-binding protein [Faecalibacterium prausnitzii]